MKTYKEMSAAERKQVKDALKEKKDALMEVIYFLNKRRYDPSCPPEEADRIRWMKADYLERVGILDAQRNAFLAIGIAVNAPDPGQIAALANLIQQVGALNQQQAIAQGALGLFAAVINAAGPLASMRVD